MPVLVFRHSIYGRDQELSEILIRLLEEDVWITPASLDTLGVGKTTLAYLVATQGLNTGQFAWVVWIKSGAAVRSADELGSLSLPESANGLVVLDDVWFDVPDDWLNREQYRVLLTTERGRPDGYPLDELRPNDGIALLTELVGAIPEIDELVRAYGTLPVMLVNLSRYLRHYSPSEALAGVQYLAQLPNPFHAGGIANTYKISLSPSIQDEVNAFELRSSVEDVIGVPAFIRLVIPHQAMTSALLGDMGAWALDQNAGLALAVIVNGYRWMVRQSLQTTLQSHARAANIGMLELGQELENQRLITQALMLLTLSEGENGQPNLDRLAQLLDQAEGFPQVKALAEGLAGNTYLQRESYQAAGEHYAWAANYFHQAAEPIGEGRMLLAIARLHVTAGQLEQAEKLLFHALPLLTGTGAAEFAVRFELGNLHLLTGKAGAALHHFNTLIERGEAWLASHRVQAQTVEGTVRLILNSPTLDLLVTHMPLADQVIEELTLRLLVEQASQLRQNLASISAMN